MNTLTLSFPLRAVLRSLAGGIIALATLAAPAHAADDTQRLIDQGRSLSVAADCMACHTAKDGKPYAGGYAIQSPLGAIYATNITPSKTSGIGDYTEAEFARALRQGVRRDGSRLYPAMPYTSYTLLSDADVHALYVYFMQGVAPVDTVPARTQLAFPFNIRASMMGWNALYLDDKRFEPDPSKSEEINRGAYLSKALAHCSACHTPRDVMMAEDGNRELAGGSVGPWYAPNITSDTVSGIGGWSNAELVQYLRTGRVAGRAQAGGGMAEAIENSLQHLPESDLLAIVAYLKSTTPIRDAADTDRGKIRGAPVSDEARLRGVDKQNANNTLRSGAALFSANCASCHQANGAGSTGQAYPSLFHNTATGASRADNLLAAILFGIDRDAGGEHVLMPRFDAQSYVDPLTNTQIADIANYVLTQYGNPDVQVTPETVQTAREGGKLPLLARVPLYIKPALVVAALIALLLLWLFVRRRRGARA